MKYQPDEPVLRDPVCGMQLSPSAAIEELLYHDKTYYFCSRACRKGFVEDPEKYILHHRQHGMKP